MKFIKKVKFCSPLEIKQELSKSLIVHAVPKNKVNVAKLYLDTINCIGKPFPTEENFLTKNKTGRLWSDIKYLPEKSESFSHSNTRQPFHTDGAYEKNCPDISFFYCIKKSLFGGATTFVDLETIISCLKLYDKNLMDSLKNKEILFYKGNDGKKSVIIDINKNRINWNYFRAEKNDIVESFHNFLEKIIFQGGLFNPITLKEGEALFFWDNKVLHGRNSFVGNRHLKKAAIYVNGS